MINIDRIILKTISCLKTMIEGVSNRCDRYRGAEPTRAANGYLASINNNPRIHTLPLPDMDNGHLRFVYEY